MSFTKAAAWCCHWEAPTTLEWWQFSDTVKAFMDAFGVDVKAMRKNMDFTYGHDAPPIARPCGLTKTLMALIVSCPNLDLNEQLDARGD